MKVLLAIWLILAESAFSFADDSERASPLTPEQERATFQLPADLDVQLVAAEPDVADPVHISWDESGRMFVCEMGDYPIEPAGGHIRMLEDTDGDGRVDKSGIFAADLHYPTSTLPYRGGVLVSAAPDILFLKDTDGDGKADVRKALFTGFGEGNQQLRVNSLIWGLDGWVYGCNGRSDGDVICVGMVDGDLPPNATRDPVSIRGRDFRFHPELGIIEPTAGFSQFGHAFDDFGNRFLSWNTVHIRHVAIDPLRLGPSGHLSPQEACTEIADHGSTGRVYPASTTTKRFNAEEPGFFNASCGLTIYRGDALPEEYRGNAFVCEPLSNLVHRDILKPDGVTFVASRAPTEQQSEFLTSTDSWFRPVNLTTGPDGALYVIDFYRELVEHPQFVANVEARERTDFRKGHEYGRIWRIVEKGAKPSRWPDWTKASTDQLVDRLGDSNAWNRETAHRLLIGGGAGEAQALDASLSSRLGRLASSASSASTRLHALWILARLSDSTFYPRLLTSVFRGESAIAKTHAVMSSINRREDSLWVVSEQNCHDLLKLLYSQDATVRLQAVIAICELGAERNGKSVFDEFELHSALRHLWKTEGHGVWLKTAAFSTRDASFAQRAESVCDRLMRAVAEEIAESPAPSTTSETDFLEALGERCARSRYVQEPARAVRRLNAQATRSAAMAILTGAMRVARDGKSDARLYDPKAVNVNLAFPAMFDMLDAAVATAGDAAATNADRAVAIRLLGVAEASRTLPVLTMLLESDPSVDIRVAAIRALANFSDETVAAALLDQWPHSTPQVRRTLLDVLLARRDFAAAIVDAIEGESLSPADFDNVNTERLKRICTPAQLARVEKLLSRRIDANRAQVVNDHQSVLTLTGDPDQGAKLFVQNCRTCHAIQGQGNRIGPDLASVARRPPADILTEILDPSRNVAPDGMNYVVGVKDGRVLAGLLAGENSESITLRRADGEDSIARSDIEELRNTGRSLMPEGFEKNLSPQDFANLLAFLRKGEPPKP